MPSYSVSIRCVDVLLGGPVFRWVGRCSDNLVFWWIQALHVLRSICEMQFTRTTHHPGNSFHHEVRSGKWNSLWCIMAPGRATMVFSPTRAIGVLLQRFALSCHLRLHLGRCWGGHWSGWATISTISGPTTNLQVPFHYTISSVKPSACNSWFKRATFSSDTKTWPRSAISNKLEFSKCFKLLFCHFLCRENTGYNLSLRSTFSLASRYFPRWPWGHHRW